MNGEQVKFGQLTQSGDFAQGSVDKAQKANHIFIGLLKDGTT